MLGTLPRRHERQFVGTGSPPPSYLQGVRSGATLFLLAAVGILAALALADALRKDDAQPAAGPATTSATTTRPEPADPSRHPSQRGDLGLRPLLGPGLPPPLAAPPAHGRRRRPERGRRGRLPVPLPRDRRTARLRALEPGRQARVSRRRDRLRRPCRPHARGSRPRRAPAPQCRWVRPEHPAPHRRRRPGELRRYRSPVVAMTISARHLEPQYLLAIFDGHDRPRRRGELPRPVPPPIPQQRRSAPRRRGWHRHHPHRPHNRPAAGASPPAALIAFSPDDRWLVVLNGTSTFLVGRSRRRSAGAHHPPADPRARPRLGARYFRDFSRSTNTSMNPGPSTSTPTWQFGSLPVRSQRST